MRIPFLLAGCLAALVTPASAQQLRPIALDDYLAMRAVADVELSPDGAWAVYVVREVDRRGDTRRSALWRAPAGGGVPQRLTPPESSASQPRFSADGRYLGFVSDRHEPSQVWVLPMAGGEAFRVTDLPGGISSFAWAPEGRRLAVTAMDADPNAEDPDAPRPPGTPAPAAPPIVVTRLQHKRDGGGYTSHRRDHLYVVSIGQALDTSGRTLGEARQLTRGPFDHDGASWSPDGTRIAVSSNRSQPDPDATNNADLWIVSVADASIRQVTTDPGTDRRPRWSPDGRTLAYVHTPTDPPIYSTPRAMTIPADGGTPTDWTGRFDRHVSIGPEWSADGRSLVVTLADSGREPLVRVTREGAKTTLADGDVADFAQAGGRTAVVMATPTRPADVFVLAAGGAPENVSRAHEALFAGLRFRAAEEVHFKSADGTPVEGWVVKPPDFDPARKYPLVLRIHGGPVAQYTDSFSFEHQYLAAQGFVVLFTNPRGSNGYGEAFCRAIFADWGNKDTEDVLAGVDHVLAQGYVDPDRLGVGGWSYGGILTNYVITKTPRFAAAISGASETDMFSAFGTDDLVRWWIDELGPPWEAVDLYRKLSPIYQVRQITTPTLIMVGERDYRVPLGQSEQLYLQLRALGRDTGLVIYPGQSHSIRRPSYEIDRLRRYGLWYQKYLLGMNVDPLYEVVKGKPQLPSSP